MRIMKIKEIFFAKARKSDIPDGPDPKALDEIQGYEAVISHLEEMVGTIEGEKDDLREHLYALQKEGCALLRKFDCAKEVIAVLCSYLDGQALSTEQAKAIYDAYAPAGDEDGFVLFREAEKILGNFSFSDFAYEDGLGYFEEADGYTLLKYLLVSKSYMLGDANYDKNRWEIVSSCYEKCVDLSIDETTPEYRAFEAKLYRNVLHQLGIVLSVPGTQAEVSA